MWKLIDEQPSDRTDVFNGVIRTYASSIKGIGVLVRIGPALAFVPGAQLYTDSDDKTTIVGAGK